MATNRLTPEEIRDAIANGTDKEGWNDLFEGFRTMLARDVDESESNVVMVAATYVLDRLFKGRNWGWQDFDTLLAERYRGEWPTVTAYAEYRQNRDRTNFVQGADEPMDPVLYIQPELGPDGGTHLVQYPMGGTIFVFGKIKNSQDVLR